MRGKRHGFSLPELMLVLVVIIIAYSACSVSYSWLYQPLVRTQALKLYTLARRSQLQAMMTGNSQEIQLQLPQQTYAINNASYELGKTVAFGYRQGMQGPPSAPAHLLHSPCTFKQNRIICYPSGVVSAGSLYITDRDRTVQYALSSGVGNLAGLHLYRYNAQWQRLW